MLSFKNINRCTVILLIGLLLCDYVLDISLALYVIIAAAWFTITSIGSFHIGWNYHLKALNSNTSNKNRFIAITFDDGPNNTYTPQVLKLLKTHNAKATFFCIGKHIETHPTILEDIVSQGHTVGNHTYTHSPAMGFFRTSKLIDELNKTNAIAEPIIGKKMKLFRPPFGVTNPSIAKTIQHTKHHIIGWNIRSLDTMIKDEQKLLHRMTKRITPGSVILLHDTSERSVVVLEQLLLFLQKNGYQSVTIDTLFNIEAYA